MRLLLLLIPFGFMPAVTSAAPKVEGVISSLVVDGTAVRIDASGHNFELVEVKNQGTLIMGSLYLITRVITVDNTSRILSDGMPGGVIESLNAPYRTGCGGAWAGRGGGPYGGHAYDSENVLRRIDEPIMGGFGAQGVNVHIACTVWPPHDIDFTGGYGGDPGGALQIRADHAEILGAINVNGRDGKAYENWRSDICFTCYEDFCDTSGGGGGSGGTLQIIVKDLIIGASATLSANGGAGGQPKNEEFTFESGYAGGGGRVQIYYQTGSVSPNARIEAKAGVEPHTPEEVYGYWAGDGTVYIKQMVNVQNLFTPSADVNNDGKVDQVDLFTLTHQWGNAEPTPAPTFTPTYPGGGTATPTVPGSPRPTRTPVPTRTPTFSPTPEMTETPATSQ